MNVRLGTSFDLEGLVLAFNGKLHPFDGSSKVLVIPFFSFQYPKNKEGFRARISATEILAKYGLLDLINENILTHTQHMGDCASKSKSKSKIGIGSNCTSKSKSGIGIESGIAQNEDEALAKLQQAVDKIKAEQGYDKPKAWNEVRGEE